MATCDYCDSWILFGGKKHKGRTFCNDDCLASGKLIIAGDKLPGHAVDARVHEIHQGECPECESSGPIDVHMAHSVWSLLYITSWKSTPNLCCRSCGRGKQFKALVGASMFGWWGFPWGLLMTPIQIGKNISGMLGGPNPDVPSEPLESMVRIELAARVANGEPLPGGRRKSKSGKAASAPNPDEPIPVECEACGKQFKAKPKMAGKSGKCPGCGERIQVPEIESWDDEEEWYESEDSYDYDSYDDEYGSSGSYDDDYDDWDDRPPKRRSGASSRSARRQKKKASPNPVRIIIGVVAFFVIAPILAGIAVFFGGGNDPRPPAPVAQNQPQVAPVANPAERQPANSAPPQAQQLGNQARLETTGNPDNSPPGITATQTTPDTASAAETAPVPVEPLPNVDPGARLWVVLSNLREGPRQGLASFNRPFLVDYQIAGGTPDPGQKYVLHVTKNRSGIIQQFADVPVELQASGTIQFASPPTFGPGEDFKATIALSAGNRKWKHLSGEITPGGERTSAEPPPTIKELAGTDAQGKTLAIANAKFEAGSGPFPTLSFEFAVQGQPTPNGYYLLVAEPESGEKVEMDLTIRLRQTQVGQESRFAARMVGPGGQLKPPFSLYVVRRNSRFPSRVRPEEPEVVSNALRIK